MANGLINLQTDLTSLRYGSEKPLITKNIGQAPGSQIGLQVERRVDDTSRIAQILTSKPGFKYLANEALLNQTTNDRSIAKARKDGKSVVGALLKQLKYTVQLVGSTLLQVPVNGTGTHFVKGFRTDTYLQDKTTSGFASLFGEGGVEGAQYAINGTPVPVGKPGYQQTTGIGVQELQKISRSNELDTIAENELVSKSGNAVQVDYEDNTYLYKKKVRRGENVIKETRLNLGDQGARSDEKKGSGIYWTTSNADPKKSLEIDKINFLDVFDSINRSKPDGNTIGRDLIKFRFHVITPDTTRILYFRAFLDSFADNYSGQWNPVKYLGRAEDFQIYSGFQRKISLSFKIAAATRSEMQPLYKKMVYLASATAPTYANSGQFMRGTIVKLTLGDYVYELPGVLNSCNFTWNTEYPWEIAMTEPENGGDYNMQELPMVLDCSIDFTPIHEFTPETGFKKYFTSGLGKGGGTKEQGERFFEPADFGSVGSVQTEPAKEKDLEAEARTEAAAAGTDKIPDQQLEEVVIKRRKRSN